MSFTGDLEHLPIVDIIQLLHQTRKSGTLCLKCYKGESQLVFKDGYIVSANHVNNSFRIGNILLEMNAISPEAIEQALLEQKKSGPLKTPLIAILVESGQIKKEIAFKGLEALIEMTIVEVLTWTEGSFSLDINQTVVSDEYRYFPEKFKQDFSLDTQSVLMDALRIYDEKKRDGALEEEDWLDDDSFSLGENLAQEPAGSGEESAGLSADDLGLGDLDKLEKRIPEVFSSLKDYDPAEIHRRIVREQLSDFPSSEQEKFVSFLMSYGATGENHAQHPGSAQALILLSRDELVKHAVIMAGKQEGTFVFTTDEEENLDLIIDQSIAKELTPILVVDQPEKAEGKFSKEELTGLRQGKLAKYPCLSIIQLTSSGDCQFTLQALREGVRTVFPKPGKIVQKETFVEDTILFLDALQLYLKRSFAGQHQHSFRRLSERMAALKGITKAPDAAFALLNFASDFFERSMILVVGKGELIAERGIGVKADKSAGATPAMRFTIPLAKPSLCQDVIEKGRLFCGHTDDLVIRDYLHKEIGAPVNSKMLLLPLKNNDRVIALIYADFGPKAALPVQTDILEVFTRHVSLVLDNALLKKV